MSGIATLSEPKPTHHKTTHGSFARFFNSANAAAGEASEFSRSGVGLLGVLGAVCLECDEPAAEAGELIRRQLGNSFGDLFDFHVAQYSTAEGWLSKRDWTLPDA